jgi:hypothetical protein
MYLTLMYRNQDNRAKGDKGTYFQGRNGMGLQKGVDICLTSPEIISLTPLSSRGPANCYIEIPLEEINAFVEKLLMVAKNPAKGVQK